MKDYLPLLISILQLLGLTALMFLCFGIYARLGEI